jgi:hypothetical protein
MPYHRPPFSLAIRAAGVKLFLLYPHRRTKDFLYYHVKAEALTGAMP